MTDTTSQAVAFLVSAEDDAAPVRIATQFMDVWMDTMKIDALVGDAEYYATLAARHLAESGAEAARRYRQSDDEGLGGPTHADYGALLADVCASFGRPIDVLDLGCGTGRYWHHLKNVRYLIGVDVSPAMLKFARHPVCEEAVTFPRKLLCLNIHDISFADNTFDLVYAIGVLGRFLPLDACIVAKVQRWLKPGGVFVTSANDAQTYRVTNWKHTLAHAVLPVLPVPWQRRVRVRLRDLSLTEPQLHAMVASPDWRTVTITRRGNRKTEWVVRATKAEG